MTKDPNQIAPAFYAASGKGNSRWSDWWLLLHPPYTLWHLAYVAIGACLAPSVDGERLIATLLAFGLAVGISAHALDELQGRPLRTGISSATLIAAATISLIGAVAIGVVGISRIGIGLVAFIVVGVVLVVGYNLELLGGRLHNDALFAAAWGSFPVLVAYYAQAETISVEAVAAAVGAYAFSAAQRALSSPARALRRRVTSVEGTMTYNDGQKSVLTAEAIRIPLESALKAMTLAIIALAVALAVYRFTSGFRFTSG